MRFKCLSFLFLICFYCFSQSKVNVSGKVISDKGVVVNAIVTMLETQQVTVTDEKGNFKLDEVLEGEYKLQVSCDSYTTTRKKITVTLNTIKTIEVFLNKNSDKLLDEVVVSGTLKAVKRIESPVPVEVYTPVFFKKNPTPNIYEALQNVNGVRPQLNCGVCNTGDIHMNGLEGPYTLVLIDGMPIVSSLSTVYGLSGIPNSLVERIEIVKGPASSLYGSEAVGGLINIITKSTQKAEKFTADYFSTSYLEHNVDVGLKYHIGKKVSSILGLNYFKNGNRVDKDKDGFTDVSLADRISLFQKWSFERNENRVFTVAVRGVYEDRFGGQINWEPIHRGGDLVYGESIFTKRAEVLGVYQLPTVQKLMLSFSGNVHYQDSRYGTTSYIANQKIAFTQLVWDKKLPKHDWLLGSSFRFNFYDDNTPTTQNILQNSPEQTVLPGVFVQDEFAITKQHSLLLGARYDYHSVHKGIFTPRLAYKWRLNETDVLRFNTGSGFRVVNLFTEDHAALTGSREVVIKTDLQPEQSLNWNLNYLKKIFFNNGAFIGIETSVFRTYFQNKIVNDYESDPNKIIYDNINGYVINQGISTNIDLNFMNGIKVNLGASYLDNYNVNNGQKTYPLLTEKISGAWSFSFPIKKWSLLVDYTGNIYGPMKLPLLNELDPRASHSPTHSIQNIQLTFTGVKNFEIYGGVKNLLNFLPKQQNPFLIANANDPFDKNVQFDGNGQVLATPQNPYGLTFDTTYVYAQNMGIRAFLGIRYKLK